MKIKQIVACAAVVAATGVSAPVFAGATGNVGAFSEYMFRGLPQSSGAAVQGGLDYASDVGLYAGVWGSNTSFGGRTEVDLYGGYATKLGNLGVDLGALYYYYGESQDESSLGGDQTNINTLEFYVGGSFGPLSAKVFYADKTKFFGVPDANGKFGDGLYVTSTYSLPLKDTLNLNFNAGYYTGDAIEDYLGAIGSNEDSYIDYGVTLAKTLDAGFTATVAVIGTDIEGDDGSDNVKYVIGLKKSFDL